MSQDVFEIGSHTVNHVITTHVSEEQVRFELDESRRAIAEEIGVSPLAFCYPNGNYDERIARLVSRSGYACATTTEHGLIGRRANLYALPRLGMHQDVAGTANGLALLLSGIR
jgi:peptidoglycan/xylan/chitin deacetylase (PgdA/CDA1 family)